MCYKPVNGTCYIIRRLRLEPLFAREQQLLDTMTEVAEASRHLSNARVRRLLAWIRQHLSRLWASAGPRGRTAG